MCEVTGRAKDRVNPHHYNKFKQSENDKRCAAHGYGGHLSLSCRILQQVRDDMGLSHGPIEDIKRRLATRWEPYPSTEGGRGRGRGRGYDNYGRGGRGRDNYMRYRDDRRERREANGDSMHKERRERVDLEKRLAEQEQRLKALTDQLQAKNE